MGKWMEEMVNEAILNTRIETARRMIMDGQLELDDIAKYSRLPLEKVQELAGDKKA